MIYYECIFLEDKTSLTIYIGAVMYTLSRLVESGYNFTKVIIKDSNQSAYFYTPAW